MNRMALVSMVLLVTACREPAFPCRDSEPRCDPGYTCVKERGPLGTLAGREVCMKREALDLGETCTVSEECRGYNDRTSVCADMWRRCPTADDKNCELKCRPVCMDHAQCGPDQICWVGGGDIPGVCQEGECGQTEQDCPDGLECTWFKSGPSGGVCYAPCDLLRQIDCDSTPPPVDAKCCAPQETCVHFAANPAAATCLKVGTGELGENCDTEEADGLPSCKEGMFCDDLLGCNSGGNCHGRCRQYCNLNGGSPACDQAGATCRSFQMGVGLPWGFCN